VFPQGASRRLIAAFVLLLLLPAVAVVWLGVRLIVQDRQIELDQLRKQRDRAATQIVNALNERLSAAERNLGSGEPPGDDAVTVVFGTDTVETRPAKRLLYRPGLTAGITEFLQAFAPGEELEIRDKDLNAAEAAYRRLANDPSAVVRAGALVRLARVLRQQRRAEQALGVYDELARVRDARVDGVPAELVARRARCRALEGLKQAARLQEEASALHAELVAAKWDIDRGTFSQYEGEIAAWLGSAVIVPRLTSRTPRRSGALPRRLACRGM